MQFIEPLSELAGFVKGFLTTYGSGRVELDLFIIGYSIFFIIISGLILGSILSEFKKVSTVIDEDSLERINLMLRNLEIKLTNLQRNSESDRAFFSQEVEYLYIEQSRLDYLVNNLAGKKNNSLRLQQFN